MAEPKNRNRRARFATALLALAAVLLWGASRLTWLTVEIFDDKSGAATHSLVGATWSTEQSAIALLLVASVVAALALRRVGRRLIGLVSTIGAVIASWAPMQLLAQGGDPARAKTILTSGAASQRSSAPVTVAQWAEITNMKVSVLGPTLALVACAGALFAAIVLLVRPGADSPRKNRYETKRTREEKISADLAAEPNSQRVLWDAIDADIDPTEK
ncbi:TIGR02234 family membrane protein [Corynebacterium epidermidicanis]|nr:TIGR02234 family membrane protein [Corynebacterium epidermidicanis]